MVIYEVCFFGTAVTICLWAVGVFDGDNVGILLGSAVVGMFVGAIVGGIVGDNVGDDEGEFVGPSECKGE